MSVRDEAASWEGSTVLGVAVAGLTVLAAAMRPRRGPRP